MRQPIRSLIALSALIILGSGLLYLVATDYIDLVNGVTHVRINDTYTVTFTRTTGGLRATCNRGIAGTFGEDDTGVTVGCGERGSATPPPPG